jgi:hypothetical protein
MLHTNFMGNMKHTVVDYGPAGQGLPITDALLLGIKTLPG